MKQAIVQLLMMSQVFGIPNVVTSYSDHLEPTRLTAVKYKLLPGGNSPVVFKCWEGTKVIILLTIKKIKVSSQRLILAPRSRGNARDEDELDEDEMASQQIE